MEIGDHGQLMAIVLLLVVEDFKQAIEFVTIHLLKMEDFNVLEISLSHSSAIFQVAQVHSLNLDFTNKIT